MKLIQKISILTGLFFCLTLFPTHAFSAVAGRVILTKGSVIAVSDTGESRVLKRRSEIMSGDIIKTGEVSSIQIRFIDKALMTIKANSEMNIAEYRLESKNENIKEKVFMKLVKGGFRKISGKIGKGDKSAYKIDTPAASIGIRGTNYEVHQETSGDFVMAVYSGSITVENEAGSIQLGVNGNYNFTRVSKNKSPKGLLEAPAALTKNSATDVVPEEIKEEENEKSKNEIPDESDSDKGTADETESEENSSDKIESDKGSTEETESGENSGDGDKAESNNTANVDADNDIQDTLVDSTDENSEQSIADVTTPAATSTAKNNKPIKPLAILPNSADATSSVEQETNDALAQKLIVAVEESKDRFEEALIDSGFLTEEEDLNDLGPSEVAAIDNLDNLDLLDDIPLPVNNSIFINQLYDNLPSIDNLFPEGVISQEEYNLVASGKLGIMVMPMEYSQEAASGNLSFNFEEAIIISPNPVTTDISGTYVTALPAGTAGINLSYEILNTTNNTTTEFNISIPINATVTSKQDLLANINAFISSDIYASINTIDPTTSEFSFKSGPDPDKFLIRLELYFDGDDADTLETMLGGDPLSNNDDWTSEVDLDMFIDSGAWDLGASGGGRPILVLSDPSIDQNGLTINEVAKPSANLQLTNSLKSFTDCGNSGQTCSIQVNKDKEKIRWGAWLTEPGNGIQIYEQATNPDGSINNSNLREENQTLAFWVAAERADINTLSGAASFSTNNLNCLDYSQCIGFSEDGIVQNLTGKFDVNFNTGAITDGKLNIEVLANGSNVDLGIPSVASSIWDVNFSGQMATDKPEFITNNISGTVTGTTLSTQVIGNIGGIFVDPGNIFAGGYNLGTADGTNKKVSGVFTLDKE
ncbi:MAG: hypothetical protein ACJA0E_001530 [Bermanella sp.]|jgi:hypothetical protein